MRSIIAHVQKLTVVVMFSIFLFGGTFLGNATITTKTNLPDVDLFSKNINFPFVQAQETEDPKNFTKTRLVYHLSSDEPWRATIALLDSQTMLKMGYNVTLMLSIEGVQLGVKSPHQYLGLQPLTKNVSDFVSNGGNVIVCEVCLKIAGYNNTDIIEGSIIGSPKIMANLLNQTTVVDY
jgi:predicted peroxiredoxin